MYFCLEDNGFFISGIPEEMSPLRPSCVPGLTSKNFFCFISGPPTHPFRSHLKFLLKFIDNLDIFRAKRIKITNTSP